MIEENKRYFNRELSWLSFNYRVLQEAKDKSVPLFERMKFLAIYSSNLDEFFRVRVASLKHIMNLKKKTRKKFDIKPNKLLKKINRVVLTQQEEFGTIYREQILPELEKKQVFIRDEYSLPKELFEEVKAYYLSELKPLIKPVYLNAEDSINLEDKMLYLMVKAEGIVNKDENYAIIQVPSDAISRFHSFKQANGNYNIFFLEDIIRLWLDDIFPGKVLSSYSVKLSRDAELYIEDEYSGDLVEKIRKSLSKRKTGLPSRLLYDSRMPENMLNFLTDKLLLDDDDVITGGKYHNLNDFFSFPNPEKRLPKFKKAEPLKNTDIESAKSFFPLLKQKDILLYYPYHKYDYVIDFLEEVANDNKVKDIKVTFYRVAKRSKVAKALITALKNGKTVTVFVEIKARFDEESNLYWAEQLKKAGAKVLYSIPGLKIHAKLCLVSRNERNKDKHYCYLATGNFNEKTAKLYTDIGMFTSNEHISKDVIRVFKQLSGNIADQNYKHLLVAPNHLRIGLIELIDQEIVNACKGLKASITLKLNSLEDTEMINKLYEASQNGVNIKIIVRGICCLIPEVKGMSENIKVKSIVGQYLEHARIFMFHAQGEEKIYVSSADLMKRNLSRRVEVAFPIYDPILKNQIKAIINLQLQDNVKARKINISQSNPYAVTSSNKKVDSQQLIYNLF